ncbi:Protein of unknown function (DUF3176) domain containing protein [Rhypophila decipiens]
MAYQHLGHARSTSNDDVVSSVHDGADLGDGGVRGSYPTNRADTTSPDATLNSGYTGTEYHQQLYQHQQTFQQQFPSQFILQDQQYQQYPQYQTGQQPQPEQYQQVPLQQADQVEPASEAQYLQQNEKPAGDVDVSVTQVAWRRGSKQSGGSSLKSGDSGSSSLSMFSKVNSWSYETMSILLAFAALGGIIAVLVYFDGKPLPSWPSSITINAVIAVLATITTACMSVPLSSGLGQLKWIRFKQGRAPLSDMEMFDDASRSAFGALGLLFKFRGGFAGSFGSVIMVLALFLSPFSQQIATFPNRNIHAPQLNATSLRSTKYALALRGKDNLKSFVPILPLKTSVYYGLFAENNKPWLGLDVQCGSGNCTWEPIDTLAICHSCVDMSEYMTRYCSKNTTTDDGSDEDKQQTNLDECGWQLPSGAKLNSSHEVFSMTSILPNGAGDASYSTLMKLMFMGTEAQNGIAGDLRPWAQQCTLTTCVQRIEASITNGDLNETVISVTTNDTVPRGIDLAKSEVPIRITSPSPNGTVETYEMTRHVVTAIQVWFSDLFRNGTASRSPKFTEGNLEAQNVLVNLTVGISEGPTFFDTDIVQAFYWNYYEYPKGIEMLMHDMAVSMTVSLRSIGGEKVQGTAYINQTYVHVQWGFVAVPVLAVVLTTLFLVTVIWKTRTTRTMLWKTSALAMLFHGLDEDARERFEDSRSFAAKLKEARGVKVRLSEEGGRTSLKLDRLY